ncbi:concanavalin A-like lectin/glucanase domain-containing protein [Cercophora newfieldiana]|uniref:Concanavalin A-like lectin/glucanase domain-containing protein n=1 Tax=Cercophora newfieldiana TaxID=92897 RepID=A0AA40CMJ3_9PEZI|nr:concanavalin A-like lectin/glucanase domain-containing protein [Cercophora newfieldiana]
MASQVSGPPLSATQTLAECNPMKTDCPPVPALGKSFNVNFDLENQDSTWTPEPFEVTKGSVLYGDIKGLGFPIRDASDNPTITLPQYIFFGSVHIVARAATGTGIVTSFVLRSQDLDEISFGVVGDDNSKIQTNYVSKGCNDTLDRREFHPVSNLLTNYNTYSIVWTPKDIYWMIEGATIRRFSATDAKGCNGYPQSPMQLKIGTWVAGSANTTLGSIEWTGGITDFNHGPFRADIKSVRVSDISYSGIANATQYRYGDRSGLASSIIVETAQVVGNDIDKNTPDASPSPSPSDTFSNHGIENNGVNAGAIAGIVIGVVVACALVAVAIYVKFFRRRKTEATLESLFIVDEKQELDGQNRPAEELSAEPSKVELDAHRDRGELDAHGQEISEAVGPDTDPDVDEKDDECYELPADDAWREEHIDEIKDKQ